VRLRGCGAKACTRGRRRNRRGMVGRKATRYWGKAALEVPLQQCVGLNLAYLRFCSPDCGPAGRMWTLFGKGGFAQCLPGGWSPGVMVRACLPKVEIKP